MSTFCVIRNKAFKDQAKRVNVSEDALERIWHKFINEKGDPNITPTDEDIQKEYEGYHVESSKNYNMVHTLWESSYSNPIIFDTLDEAQNKKAELATLFKESAIVIKPLNNNTFEVKVAEPTLAGTVVKLKNDIFEGIKPEIQAEMEEIKQKAIADGTFMKAPNGQPTKLNERQWLQVRTKEFKEWFGDWEKIAELKNLDSDFSIIENNEETPDEVAKGYDIIYNGKKIGRVALIEAPNGNLTIRGIGIDENIRGKGIGKNLYKWLIYKAYKNGGTLYSDNVYDSTISPSAHRVWKSLIKENFAVEDNYSGGYHSALNASKVVDENGEPLVVYHYTNNPDFNIFDFSRIGENWKQSNGYGRPAMFFLSYLQEEGMRDWGKNVMPVFLNIRNPEESSIVSVDRLPVINENTDGVMPPAGAGDIRYNEDLRNLRRKYDRDQSYNGDIESKARREAFSNSLAYIGKEPLRGEFAVFNPNQIKSATDNNGEFSDIDNNIYRNIKRRTPIVLDSSKEGKRLKSLIRKAIEGSEENSSILKNPIFPKERTTITFDELTKIILSRNPEYKDLLQLFKEANPNLNIIVGGESEIIDENGEVYIQHGVFEPSYNTLYLSHAADIQTAIHELAHAATVYGMARYADNKISFRRKIDQFVDYVKDYINENSESVDKNLTDLIYGFTDSYEFVAEIFSNPSFRDLLEEIPPMEEKKFKSLFGQLWNAILDFLNDIFGGNKLSKNALEQAKKLSFSAVKLQQQRLDIIDKTLQSNLKQYASHSELKRIVYNKEQEAAINATVEHIQNVMQGKSSTPFYTIQGKAGTGKTTIINEILNRLNISGSLYTPRVFVGAPTLKATSVIQNKIDTKGSNGMKYNFSFKSIQGMLGMKPTGNGEYIVDPHILSGEKPYPISAANVVFIDEASMVSEELLEYLTTALKKKRIPVIFIGDIGQLPPVRKSSYYRNKDISESAVSPVFTIPGIKESRLQTRVRQGEESPVLEYADKYWNFSEEVQKNYPNDLEEVSSVTDRGALIMQRTDVKLEKQLLPLFEEAKKTGNPNLVKIVAYKNETVDSYNRAIREALYPNLKGNGFQKGDLIIFNDTFGDSQSSIPNSWESAIINVKDCNSNIDLLLSQRGIDLEDLQLEEVEREYISFKGPNNAEFQVPALINTAKNKKNHENNIKKIRQFCSDVFKGKYGRKYSYSRAAELRDYYVGKYAANVGYAYAITSHKSQGSTYEVVAVDVADINSVSLTTLKTKSRSIYTALTRASNVTIVSSSTTNENIIYTENAVKDINDRINAVKRGEEVDSNFVPETEENPYFTDVTEEDLGDAIKGLKKKTQKSKNKGKNIEAIDIDDPRYNAELPEIDPDEELSLWDDDDDSEEEPTKKAKKKKQKEERKKESGSRKAKKFEEKEEEELDDDNSQDRTYKEFVAKQRQLSSCIKFRKASHTYLVNGKKADFSVTQFKDFILDKETDEDNIFLKVAGKLGTSHDSVLRDFFDDDVEVANKYPNLSAKQIKLLKAEAQKLKDYLIKEYGDNAIFITDESLLRIAAKVTYEGKEYTVAGTMDMVVIDEDGYIHIIDFKTKRANTSKVLKENKKLEYGIQLSIYKGGLKTHSTLKDKIANDTQIAQFNIKYVHPKDYEYSFKDDQVYIETDDEVLPIEETSGLYTSGKLYAAIPLSNPLKGIKITGIRTAAQKSAESKRVDEEERIDSRSFRGQMKEFYGREKRKGIKATSTLYAIREGKRTATTRLTSDGHMDYWKKVKKGDLITFHDTRGNEITVRCTVPFHKLDENTDVEEWSKKEGWSESRFENKIYPAIRSKKDDAWQMEYELVRDEKEPTATQSIEINSFSKKFALLSNFGDKPFEIDGKEFPTVEHYFQWVKAVVAKDSRMANKIYNAKSPSQARTLGKYRLEMTKKQLEKWDSMSRNTMKKGMREAFEQNEDAQDLLLSTGEALLTHRLGGPFADILMELRKEFGGAGKPETVEEATERAKETVKKGKIAPKATTKESEDKNIKLNKTKEWISRGSKQFKISSEGYKKGDPQNNKDTAFIFTENAEAYSYVHDIDLDVDFPYKKDPKINVSDVRGTNQAGIRTDSEGNISENAFGIVVKKYQQNEDGKFVAQEGTFKDNDEDFTIFQMLNEDMFDKLEQSGLNKIVFPSQIAMGKSALPKKFADWLANELYNRYRVKATVTEREENDKGYEGYGLIINEIEEQKTSSDLHVEEKDKRYTPKNSSEVDAFNTAAQELRNNGWHVEFYKKKSKDGSITNEVMTISLQDNPNKGFFELVKDVEEDNYSVHFKTKSKKALNETPFADDSLEDEEKENMFKALIFAIPEGGIVSTWGELSKGGEHALDTLGERSEGILVKVADRTLNSGEKISLVPVYKKLSEEEMAESFINKAKTRKANKAVRKLQEVEEDSYIKLSQSNFEDSTYTGLFTISLNDSTVEGIENPDITDGSKDSIIASRVRSCFFSSILTLDRKNVNKNYLYTLNKLLENRILYPVWSENSVTIDPDSEEGKAAKKYAKENKNFRYDFETGKLMIPEFTVGYTQQEIIVRSAQNKLLNNSIINQSQLRSLAKATIYKASEIITSLQTYKNAYEKFFGEKNDTDFTQLSRIEIIKQIGLSKILDVVRKRVFDSEYASKDTARSTIKKMNLINENWQGFVQLGYDTLIGIEEIAFTNEGKIEEKGIKNDLNDTIEDEDESTIQELFGNSLEHWQVGFRQVSAFNSLSTLIKRALDSLYQLDENGNQIKDEFKIAEHLNPQEAVSKILYYTQGSTSLDYTHDGRLDSNSMLQKLKDSVEAEPWLQQIIDLLEDKYDEDGNCIKKADEQFKSQFYSNFQKYFQKYAITYKDDNKGILIKIINERQYADVLLKQCQAKENSFALGDFKLKTTEGKLNKLVFAKVREIARSLEKYKKLNKGNSKKISKDIDLDAYHKDLKDLFNLLDIDTPADQNLYNIFGLRANLNKLTDKLSYLIDKINSGDLNITTSKEYKEIVSIVAQESELEIESVSYEAGKLYYSYVNPSYLGKLITKLSSENMSPTEYNQFLEREYFKYPWFFRKAKNGKRGKIRNYWLRRLKESEEVRNNIAHVTSLHFLGKEYTDKSPVEYIASMFKMFMYDNGPKNKRWAYYRVPTLSNKPSEEYIRFERIHTGFKNIIIEELWNVFLQELDRIQAVRQRANNIEEHQKITSKGKSVTFDKNGLEFVILDYFQKYLDGSILNDVYYDDLINDNEREEYEKAKEFHSLLNSKLDGTIKENSSEYARLMILFKEIAKKEIEEKYNENRQQWVDEGFITLDKNDKIKKTFNNMKITEKDLEEFFWNDMFASINILELTVTDPAYYKDAEDLQKRLAQLHSPGMQANIYAKDKNGNFYTDGTERTIYVKDDIVKSSTYTNLKKAIEQIVESTPAERKVAVSKQLNGILDAFKKINFADAQGFSCPSSYRKKMGIFGNWSDRMEDAYQALLHPEDNPDTKIEDLLDVLWQPLKPFVYTQIEKPGYNDVLPTLKVGVQNKNSEFVLVMADALMRRAGIPNKLKAIYDFMEESQHNENGELNGKGIDTIQFMSAVNAGCNGVIDLNDEKDSHGNIIKYKTEEEIKQELGKAYVVTDEGVEYSKDYVQEIPFEDYIIQQNVPNHFANHEQIHGSQNRILTFADMLDKDPETGEDNYLIIDGKKVTVAKAKEDYFKAIADNIEESKQKLIERFKLDSSDEREKNVAISRALKEAILKDSRFGADLLWACDTNEDGEFNIPLSDPTQSNRIQQLLNSIIKNTINKQEIAGGPVVQVSSWGTSDQLNIRWQNEKGQILLTEKEFNEGPFPQDYSKMLKISTDGEVEYINKWKQIDGYSTYEEYIEDQAGVAYFEAFIPIQDEKMLEDFMKKDKFGNIYIDVEAIEKANPDLLNMVGYRIPTESKYSMAPIKVKGYLPRTAGEGIMLPADITTLAGSDFDIDKLYTMYYTFIRKEKDGKITYEKPKSGRGYRNNLIISTELAVLRSNQVRQQLFTPGNFDEPKKYGYLISYVQEEAQRTGRDPREIYDEAKNLDIDTLKDKSMKSKNLVYNNVQVQFHKQNMVAGKLIGIFAQANVSHAFISLVDNPTIFVPNEYAFTLDGQRIEGNGVKIDSIFTLNNEKFISNNIAAFLAASVDAVKDPILNLININTNTVNAVVTLLRLGFDTETVGLLCSQPIIKQFVKEYNLRRASYKISMNTVLKEFIAKAKKAIDLGEDEDFDDIKLTKENMIDNLTGESDVNNYMVLKVFEKVLAISDTVGDITHMTRYNSITSAVGPFATDTMILRIKDKKFRSNTMITASIIEACNNPILAGYNKDASNDDTHVSGFRDASDEVERLILGQNIIQAGDRFFMALKKLSSTLGYDRGVPSDLALAFSDFYMSFYVNAGINGTVFDLSYENRRDTLTKFPRYFNKLKNKYKDNIFINSILYIESDTEQYPFLQLRTRGLTSQNLEDIKQAWVSLYMSDDKTAKYLAIRLAEYNFFRGSFGFSPKTFMNLVPNIIKNDLNNYIDTLNRRDSLVEEGELDDRIIKQFLLHNTEYINERFTKLNQYDPQEMQDSTYGECLLINKKPNEDEEKPGKDINTLKKFIIIDKSIYYVVNQDSSSMILKKVEALGGDGQGFEIDINNDFPKTIYDKPVIVSSKKRREGQDDSSSGIILEEDQFGVIMDQLYQDDEELEKVISMPPASAIVKISKDLKSAENVTISTRGRNQRALRKIMKEARVKVDITDTRVFLNNLDKSIKDLKLCD